MLVLDLDIRVKHREFHTKLFYVILSNVVCPGNELLARIVAMLTRLVERFDPDEFRVREDGIDG